MSVTLNKFAQYANYLRRLIHIFFIASQISNILFNENTWKDY